MSYPSPVEAAVRRSRRQTSLATPPMRPDPVVKERLCKCGVEKFWDDQARRWLCPARFDGEKAHVAAS